jgi:RHS repeat-associated protein
VFGRLLSETTVGSQPSRDYVWAGGTPVAQVDHWVPIGNMLQMGHCHVGADGKIDWVTFLHTDGLGTPRTGTDIAQNLVWRWDGEGFGETAPTQTVPSGAYPVIVNLRNPGQYFDLETGLFYNRARYYNPQTGRYISSDPIGLAGGLNTYAYVGENPFSLTDPLGLWTGQVGISVSIDLGGPFTFNISAGIAFDGHGNVASYNEIGGGASTSPDASIGISLHESNGDSIDDLNGPFVNLAVGGGWGPHATGDAFTGIGSQGQLVEGGGLTIGIGIGAAVSTTITDTTIGLPISQPSQPQSCPAQ